MSFQVVIGSLGGTAFPGHSLDLPFLKGREVNSNTSPGVGDFLKVCHFYIQKLLFPWQNCVTYLKTNYFFCHHTLMKKGHSKLSKNETENITKIKITYL